MKLIELYEAIETFQVDSTVIISGPAGDYAAFDAYEEDGTVYIDVVPIGDTRS